MSMKTKNQIAISLPEEGDAYWTGFLNVIKLSGEESRIWTSLCPWRQSTVWRCYRRKDKTAQDKGETG